MIFWSLFPQEKVTFTVRFVTVAIHNLKTY